MPGKRRSYLMLLTAAAIWGFAFVAQRKGMEYIGPFTFNGIRFSLGALSLIPVIYLFGKGKVTGRKQPLNKVLIPGIIMGFAVFAGVSFQQLGIVYTTAGKAGFITGLYVIIVPVLGIFLRKKTGMFTWLGAIASVAGLWFMAVDETALTMQPGDLLVLIGAFFWAVHVHLVGRFSDKYDVLQLAFIQFAACAILSSITGMALETVTVSEIEAAAVPILYAGLMSVGVAYTLQVAGQKGAHPSSAAIILSSESLFAVLGGSVILHELMSGREISGMVLMFAGMVLAQLKDIGNR